MLRKTLLTTAAMLVSGVTLAADLPYRSAAPVPYMTPVFTWTGFYVGVNGGYAGGEQKLQSIRDFGSSYADPVPSYVDNKLTMTGGLIGGTVGYNYQMGAAVLGVEADFNWADIKGSRDIFPGYVSVNSKIDYFGTLRARVGYAFGNLLPYITGGLYWQHSKGGLSIVEGPSASGDDTRTGWTLGGGVEFAINNNWSIKGEYLYARVNDNKYDLTGPDFTATTKNHVNIVRAGLNYRF